MGLDEETEMFQVFIGCGLILIGLLMYFSNVAKDLGPLNIMHPIVRGLIIAFVGVAFFTRGFVQLLGEKYEGIGTVFLGVVVCVGGLILTLPVVAPVSLGFATVGVVGLFLVISGFLFSIAAIFVGPKIRAVQKEVEEEEEREYDREHEWHYAG